jgi:hypothetical protein
MGAIEDLLLIFEGAGDKDPDTGQFLSGVWRPVTPAEEEQILKEKIDQDLAALNHSLDLASKVLLDRCKCPQGAAGAKKLPWGCEGGATTAEMAKELGLAPKDGHRSRKVRDALLPAIELGYVRSMGQTESLRWHWGRGSDAKDL